MKRDQNMTPNDTLDEMVIYALSNKDFAGWAYLDVKTKDKYLRATQSILQAGMILRPLIDEYMKSNAFVDMNTYGARDNCGEQTYDLEPFLRHILYHIVRHDKWIMSWAEADQLDDMSKLDCPVLRHILYHIVRHDKWIMSWAEADQLDYISTLDCLANAGLIEVKPDEYWKCDSKTLIRWFLENLGLARKSTTRH